MLEHNQLAQSQFSFGFLGDIFRSTESAKNKDKNNGDDIRDKSNTDYSFGELKEIERVQS